VTARLATSFCGIPWIERDSVLKELEATVAELCRVFGVPKGGIQMEHTSLSEYDYPALEALVATCLVLR